MCAVVDVIGSHELPALPNHILLVRNHQHLHIALGRESSQQLSEQSDLVHIERSVDFVGENDGAGLNGRFFSGLRTPH